jgi:hypothetical protein
VFVELEVPAKLECLIVMKPHEQEGREGESRLLFSPPSNNNSNGVLPSFLPPGLIISKDSALGSGPNFWPIFSKA